MGYKSRFRKKLFVDPAVQGAILRRLALHWAYTLATAFLCLFMIQIFSVGIETPLSGHLSAMWDRYGILFVTLLCIFPAFAYDSVKLSHRFVGPMVAVRMCLRKLADGGDVPEVTFRKGDFWTEISGDINRIAERLRDPSRPQSIPQSGSQAVVAPASNAKSEATASLSTIELELHRLN